MTTKLRIFEATDMNCVINTYCNCVQAGFNVMLIVKSSYSIFQILPNE
jgi:hypothetical protein